MIYNNTIIKRLEAEILTIEHHNIDNPRPHHRMLTASGWLAQSQRLEAKLVKLETALTSMLSANNTCDTYEAKLTLKGQEPYCISIKSRSSSFAKHQVSEIMDALNEDHTLVNLRRTHNAQPAAYIQS